jgi:hypothetical protein
MRDLRIVLLLLYRVPADTPGLRRRGGGRPLVAAPSGSHHGEMPMPERPSGWLLTCSCGWTRVAARAPAFGSDHG